MTKKKKSLALVLAFATTILCTIGMTIAGVIYNCLVLPRYTKAVSDSIENSVATRAGEMSGWFETQYAAVGDLAHFVDAMKPTTSQTMTYMNDVTRKASSDFVDVYIAPTNGVLQMASGADFSDFDYSGREWYTKALSEKKTICSAPYIDVSTGEVVITVSSPYSGGVAGVDIYATTLAECTKTLKADEAGYALLVDGAGNIVVHTGNDEFTHSIVNGTEKTTSADAACTGYSKAITEGTTVVNDYNGVKSLMVSKPVGDAGWSLVYVTPYSSITGYANTLLAIYIAMTFVIINGVSFVMYLVLKLALKPLDAVCVSLKAISEGDLTANNDIKTDVLETEMLKSSLIATTNSLRSTITDITQCVGAYKTGDFTATVSTGGKQGIYAELASMITDIGDSLSENMHTIASASSQINVGADSLATASSELANSATNQTRLITEISEAFEGVSKDIAKTAQASGIVKTKTEAIAEAISASDNEMLTLVSAMQDIEEATDKIEIINKTIEDIAFQTNILALNASIEAARAGEAGKGFAVVAGEVGNLASKSAEASKNTTELVRQAAEMVKKGAALAAETAEHLKAITVQSADIENSTNEIALAAEQESSSVEKIAGNIAEIANIVSGSAASAQESAALSEELNGQVNSLNSVLDTYTLR